MSDPRPMCPECHRPLTYDVPMDRWDCEEHGSMWSGSMLAIARGFKKGC